jgi:hypothetical protein
VELLGTCPYTWSISRRTEPTGIIAGVPVYCWGRVSNFDPDQFNAQVVAKIRRSYLKALLDLLAAGASYAGAALRLPGSWRRWGRAMRMPRWLLVSLLLASVLGIFGAGAWWWTIWPEQTVRSFAELTAAADLRGANELCPTFRAEACTVCHSVRIENMPSADPPFDPGSSLAFLWQLQRSNQSPVQPLRQPVSDRLFGRQWFEFSGSRLLVVRGRVARIDCPFAAVAQ